jgi:hypothetical protein
MRLTIGKKCFATTAVSSVLVIAAAASGYWGVRSISRTTDQMLNQDVATADDAHLVKIHVFQMRRYEKDLLLNCIHSDKVDAFGTRILLEQQELEDRLAHLRKLVYRPEDQQLVDLMDREMKVYADGIKKVTASIKAGKLKTPEDGPCNPDGAPANWDRTDLWNEAGAIPDVELVSDRFARESRRFRSLTSGQVLVYDPQGRLVFRGGITAGRGHRGDNPGRRALVTCLSRNAEGVVHMPVFGCPLFDGNASFSP